MTQITVLKRKYNVKITSGKVEISNRKGDVVSNTTISLLMDLEDGRRAMFAKSAMVDKNEDPYKGIYQLIKKDPYKGIHELTSFEEFREKFEYIEIFDNNFSRIDAGLYTAVNLFDNKVVMDMRAEHYRRLKKKFDKPPSVISVYMSIADVLRTLFVFSPGNIFYFEP